ncbi:ParB N-terminal domain-containing protein [Streptomyces sp. NPDC000345]|uniref:ParB N-terminal domain-containing protein n=1 Tax=Streptomyces sp. NPDC000345 TaxID=3364537 RepID=UPI0036B549D6
MSSAGLTEDPACDVLAHIAKCQQSVARSPVVKVPIATLVADDSPRAAGEDNDHAKALAESERAYPPIMVHRRTMRVIDGGHRLRAAQLRGHTHIAVRFFDGEQEDAFVLSVVANADHGMPLSRADRLAAVNRILGFYPEWSDRAIASVTGLSARKVAEMRRHRTGAHGDSVVRVGMDGRVRPVNRAQGRELAGELIKANPEASLRQIAKAAGISPATVADVRNRLRQGYDPVPVRLRKETVRREQEAHKPAGGSVARRRTRSLDELTPIFDALCKDPSLRFSETGRIVLRLFDSCAAVTRERSRILDNVPAHCREQVAELLLSYAEIWQNLAMELSEGQRVVSRQAI